MAIMLQHVVSMQRSILLKPASLSMHPTEHMIITKCVVTSLVLMPSLTRHSQTGCPGQPTIILLIELTPKGIVFLFFSFQRGCMCRQSAFNVAIAGWLPCGALLALVAVSLTKDEAAMQARLAHKVDNHIPNVDDGLPYTNSNT